MLLLWRHHSLAFKGTAPVQPPSARIKTLPTAGQRDVRSILSDLESLRHLICSSVVMCKSLQIDSATVYSATCHVIMTGLFAEGDWMWFGRTVHQLFDDPDPGGNNGKKEYVCTLCRDVWKTRQSQWKLSGFPHSLSVGLCKCTTD